MIPNAISKHRLPQVLLLAVSMLFAAQTTLALGPAAGDEPAKSFEEIWMADAKAYAEQYSVSLTEALFRMHQMDLIASLQHQLMTEEADTFGGLWLEHQPAFTLHVAFTTDGETTLGRYVNSTRHADLRDIVRPHLVTRSQLELIRDHKRASEQLDALGIDHDVALEIQTQRNLLSVRDAGALDQALGRAHLTLPESVVVRETDRLSVQEADLYGGLSTSPCTAGPSVWITGYNIYGVSSANHCGTVTFNGDSLWQKTCSSGYDLCGCDGRSHKTRNRVKDGPNTARIITSSRNRSQMYVGQTVYHYGKCSGFSSGTIQYLYVNTYFVGASNTSCGGDSGGPWFWADRIFGGHNGSGGGMALFTPTDYFSDRGLTIQTWDR